MLSRLYNRFITSVNSIIRHIRGRNAVRCPHVSLESNHKMPDYYDEYLLKHLNKNKINLVDIGAHRGAFVKMIEERIGIANAILVEPIPACFKYLKTEFGSRYTVLNNLILDKSSENVLFHIYDYAETSSILVIKDIEEHSGIEIGLNSDINISSLTLDVLYATHLRNTQIDLLKVDVQGAEHLVLAGAEQALKQTNFAWVEVSFKQLYDNSMLFSDIYNLMVQSGFILLEISPGHRSVAKELLQADALFKNKNIPGGA
jgi:FkbM family methyltransferase